MACRPVQLLVHCCLYHSAQPESARGFAHGTGPRPSLKALSCAEHSNNFALRFPSSWKQDIRRRRNGAAETKHTAITSKLQLLVKKEAENHTMQTYTFKTWSRLGTRWSRTNSPQTHSHMSALIPDEEPESQEKGHSRLLALPVQQQKGVRRVGPSWVLLSWATLYLGQEFGHGDSDTQDSCQRPASASSTALLLSHTPITSDHHT